MQIFLDSNCSLRLCLLSVKDNYETGHYPGKKKMEGVQLKSSQMSVCMKVSGHFPADGSYDRNKFTLLWHKPLMLWKLYKNIYKKMFIVFFKKKKCSWKRNNQTEDRRKFDRLGSYKDDINKVFTVLKHRIIKSQGGLDGKEPLHII